jgi:hypothetical protein
MDQAAAVIRRGEKRTRYYDSTRVLTCAVEYPEFVSRDFPWILNRINLFYRRKAEAFCQRCATELYAQAVEGYRYARQNGFPFLPYEALMVYSIPFNRYCTISLYFDAYQFTGGAHGGTVRTSDTWNLKEGDRMRLADFFPEGFPYRAYIFEQIDAQIAQETQSGANDFFEDARELVRQTFNEESFYLTDDGIVIYFQQYDIAPYSSGIVEFLIPYQEGVVARPGCG